MKKIVLWTPVAKYHEIFYFFWFTCLKITITTQPLIPLPPFSMLFKAKGPGHMSEQHWKWGEGVKGIFWRKNFDEVKNPKNLTSDGQRCLGIFQNLTIFHATYKKDKIKTTFIFIANYQNHIKFFNLISIRAVILWFGGIFKALKHKR